VNGARGVYGRWLLAAGDWLLVVDRAGLCEPGIVIEAARRDDDAVK